MIYLCSTTAFIVGSAAVSSKDLTPTNIRMDKKQSLKHTRIVSKFMLGFEHEMGYERNERVFSGELVITLDGRELIRESLLSVALGNYRRHFDIEGETIGLIKITGLGVALLVKVSINGVDVLKA